MAAAIPAVVDRLVAAINAHDLDALVGCFAPDFTNEWPAHPARSFEGADGVRRNWTMIFGARPTITARILTTAESDDELWGEWEFSGEDQAGEPFRDRGVIIIRAEGDLIAHSRFYMEPVEG